MVVSSPDRAKQRCDSRQEDYSANVDTDDLSCLRAVVDAGSLSAVARARAVAVSTIARRLDALEATLRLPLVVRGRDGVTLTADGARVLDLARPLLTEADRLARAVDAMRQQRPREIVVTATEIVISDVLAPAMAFAPPDLRLNLRSQGAVVSLAGREADLAVRMIPPQGASLIARKLPVIAMGLFCSTDYLAGRDGAGLEPAAERLLVYDDSWGALPEQAWLTAERAHAIVVRSNSTRSLINMAVAGAGVALLPVVLARRAGLDAVASSIRLPARTPWLVVHADLSRRPDLRAARRWVRAAFAVFSTA